MFINRVSELTHLEELYRSGRAELFVLDGRRRVGKTELVRAFCESKPNVFFIATLGSDSDQLAAFSQAIWRFNHGEGAEGFTFPSWEAAFRALSDLPGRPIVVLDEFTYLISGNKAIPSILQKAWDAWLRNTQVFVILCGSYIGMIEREVLGYQAPLYGRRTGGYLLQPLELPAAAAFFPRYAPLQRTEAWAVLGGMPYYLGVFSDADDIFANIRRHILDVQGTLYNEAHLLLMEELREPRNYFSILRAVAQGDTRLNEIAQAAGVGDGATAARYLDTLQQMRVVRRVVTATESQPEKSRKGLYQIADPFLRFWFRYVHPYRNSRISAWPTWCWRNACAPRSTNMSVTPLRMPQGSTSSGWPERGSWASCRSASVVGGIRARRSTSSPSAMPKGPRSWASASGQPIRSASTC